MAYKIQIGAARMSGSLTQEGDLTAAESNNLKASEISASTNVILHGDAGGEGAFGLKAQSGASIVAEESIQFNTNLGTRSYMKLDIDSGDGRLRLRTDDANNRLVADMKTNSNKGFISLAAKNSEDILVKVDGGDLSGSNDLFLAGNLTLAGGSSDMTVGGNLTIQGTTSDLNVSEFKTADKVVVFNQGGNGDTSGIQFGRSGLNDTGAQIKYNHANLLFDALDGDGTGNINVSASHYFGASGANLTGISSTDSKVEVNSRTANQTASLGLNIANCGAASFSVRVISGSSLSSGDEILIKRVDGHTSNTLTILANGTDDIDGEDSIVLESPRSAVSLVYNNSGSFKVF